MRKTDYNFGDTLAGDMEKIMESDEHKQMFNKIAIDLSPVSTDTSTGIIPGSIGSPSSYGFDPNSKDAVGGFSKQHEVKDVKVPTPSTTNPLTGGRVSGNKANVKVVDYPGNVSDQDAEAALLESRNSESLLETLVKVADFLGKEGFGVSEAAADRLISTLILEAAKKGKKEKEVKECKECKKPCDKCKCEDGKKGKECKEDKKAKEDKKK